MYDTNIYHIICYSKIFTVEPGTAVTTAEANDVGWANFSAFEQNMQPATNPLVSSSSSTPSNKSISAESCSNAFVNNLKSDAGSGDETTSSVDSQGAKVEATDISSKPLDPLVNQHDGTTT